VKVIMTVAAFVSQAAMTPVVWAQTDSAEDRFVESNLNSVFYHELGHAVIDLMQLPIFGQEEDAADVLSVLMIHELFEEDAAQIVAYDAAFGFQLKLRQGMVRISGMCMDQMNSVITILSVSFTAEVSIREKSWPTNWACLKSEKTPVKMNFNLHLTAGVWSWRICQN